MLRPKAVPLPQTSHRAIWFAFTARTRVVRMQQNA